jgi:hypothetical protein
MVNSCAELPLTLGDPMKAQPHIITLSVSGTGDNNAMVERVRSALKWENYTVAGTPATFHIAATDLNDSLGKLIAAIEKMKETPDNITQIWLTVQTIKERNGPSLVLPLANSFPEVIQSNFGLLPKKRKFRLWPFGHS